MNFRGILALLILFGGGGIALIGWGWSDYTDSHTASAEPAVMDSADLEGGAPVTNVDWTAAPLSRDLDLLRSATRLPLSLVVNKILPQCSSVSQLLHSAELSLPRHVFVGRASMSEA